MLEKSMAKCQQGILRGVSLGDGVSVFRGVPFAQPPVGDLRWRAARKPEIWYGIRPATEFMAMPRQRAFGGAADPRYQSEDCLYLNIWTPATSEDEKHPVYVWFYGGAYQAGDASETTFDGSYLAKKGIVTVTVNYRVGLFGFLCHPDMKNEPARDHGNFGVTDQIASLEWIRDNIAAFGGDPNRVTIGGHSAGSASVNNLMVSPLSRNLIHGAINESGDVFQPERDITFDQAAQDGLRLQEALKCASLDEMRALPTDALMNHEFDAAMANRITCTPVIDGVVIPYAQGDMLLHNDAAQIPIIVGSCADEGSGGGPGYRERVMERLGLPEALYPDESRETVSRLARDYWYGRHLAWARIRSEYGLPTYQYNFARRRNGGMAMHGDEIPYAFGSMNYSTHGQRNPYGPEDYAFMEKLNGYWVNFIYTGDPNGEGLPTWPKKDADPVHMKLDLVCEMEGDYYRPEYEVVCPLVEKWMRSRI